MDVIRIVQSYSSPWLDAWFTWMTMLGEPYVFLIGASFVLWCVDKRDGYKLGFAYLISGLIVFGLKDVFQVPRPFERDASIRVLRAETIAGYSFPSGHTVRAAAFWWALARMVWKRWAFVVGGLLIFMVALSRIYLGAHTPLDVVVGAAIGIGCLWGSYHFVDYLERTRRFELLLLIVVPALLGLLVFEDSSYMRAVGAVTSVALGYVVESRWIRFEIPAQWRVRIVKYGVGIVGLILLYGVLQRVLPDTPEGEFALYFLIVQWMTVGAPMLFTLRSRIGRFRLGR